MTTPIAAVQPGDWFVVDPGTALFDRIEWAERLTEWLTHGIDAKGKRWGHAGVATRWEGSTLYIVEAEPHGAVEVPWHHEDRPHLWSTGTGLSGGQAQADAAIKYSQPGPWGNRGVPYSYLDYVAIGAHALHVPAPGLRAYIASTMHMMCSYLTDRTALEAGKHLFSDGRWPGYVTPLDLGLLLEDAHARTPWVGLHSPRPGLAFDLAVCRFCGLDIHRPDGRQWVTVVGGSAACRAGRDRSQA